MFTEDSRVLEIRPAGMRGYVVDHKTQEAWGLHPDLRITKKGTNRLFQIITERDTAPVSLNGKGDKKGDKKRAHATISQIALESAAEARTNLPKETVQNKNAETIQLLAIILGVTVGILVLVALFMSGKLGSGGGGGESIFAVGMPAVLGLASKGKGKEELNTLVLDPVNGFGLEHVDKPKGHRWKYGRKPVFVMVRTYGGEAPGEGVLTAFELPKELGDSPRKLYRALTAWNRLTPIIFGLLNPIWGKLNTIGMYVLIVILLLVIYLIFSSVVG